MALDNRLDIDKWEVVRAIVAAGVLPFEAVRRFEPDLMLTGWSRRDVHRSLERMWAGHLVEEEEWDYVTDGDRFDVALDDLRRMGIGTRLGYGCCFACGPPEGVDAGRRSEVGQLALHLPDLAVLGRGTVGLEVSGDIDIEKVVGVFAAVGLPCEWQPVPNLFRLTGLTWKHRAPQ